MSDSNLAEGGYRAENRAVSNVTRTTFLVSSLLFLVTITLGFLNVVTTGALPRWQVLTHLHSGTVGWILLSYVGIAIWLFTGERDVSASYRQRLTWLVRLAVVAFVGLIASFAYGFSQGGSDALLPLGVFAPFAALVIWATAIFALTQLRRLPVVTTPHLLVAVGLLFAAIGVTFGAWVGLDDAFGNLLPIAHDDGIGAHFLTVVPAISVVATGVIEWMTDTGGPTRWTRGGAVQVAFGGLTGLMLPIGTVLLALGVSRATTGLVFIGLLVGAVLYTLVFLARIGQRALRANPLDGGVDAWMFFATAWFFVFVVVEIGGPALGEAEWVSVLGIHSFFVGLMTNLLLGVIAVRTSGASVRYPWAEPTAMWVLNAGIVVFVALEAAMELSHGAAVMGAGVLLGVGTMLRRLQDGSVDATGPAGESVP